MNEQISPETLTQDAKPAARRRFLGAGAKIAPVAATLLSQPALATTCFTPSRALSANASTAFKNKQKSLGQDFTCSGAGSVHTYRTNTAKWPATCDRKTAKFKDAFPSSSDTTLLKDILADKRTSIEATFIAAFLNIRGGNGAKISAAALSEEGLRTMWRELQSNGKFQLYAGGPAWNADGIRNYFYNNSIVATGF